MPEPRRTPLARSLLLAALAALPLALAAAPAPAAVVGWETVAAHKPDEPKGGGPGYDYVDARLRLDAGAGEANRLALAVDAGNGADVRSLGGAPLLAGPGCTQLDAATVRCELPRALLDGTLPACAAPDPPASYPTSGCAVITYASRIAVALGDGDDELTAVGSRYGVAVEVDAGDGADVVRLEAGRGILRGGAGDDRLTGSTGSDELRGGPGADALDGGAGEDVLDYSERTEGVTVPLGAQPGAPAGAPGEGDAVSGFEVVRGGAGPDALSGGAGVQRLVGGPGPDALAGGGGADSLDGETGDDRLDGGDGGDDLDDGSGADRLRGGAGDDRLDSDDAEIDPSISWWTVREGDDVLEGGPGDDALATAAGVDALRGGPGDDVLGGAVGRLVGGASPVWDGGVGDDRLLPAGISGAARIALRCGPGRDAVDGGRVPRSCEDALLGAGALGTRPRIARGGRVAVLRWRSAPCTEPCRIRVAIRRTGGGPPLARGSVRVGAGGRRPVVLPLDARARRTLRRGGYVVRASLAEGTYDDASRWTVVSRSTAPG